MPAFAFVPSAAPWLHRRAASAASSPTRLRSPRTSAHPGAASSSFTSVLASGSTRRTNGPTMATSLRELSGLKAIDGSEIPASALSGKVVLAVNVASACGYTSSGYELMKSIGAIDGVAVVAVPCNAFGKQENGTPSEIKAFGDARVPNLIMTERSEVNGASAHPIFKVAQTKFADKISWNFDGVYVFDKEGVPTAKFGNKASLSDVKEAVEKLL